MKLNLALALTILPFFVQGNPLAAAEAVAEPIPEALPEAAPDALPEVFDKRADKWCYVTTANVHCRKGAGIEYGHVRYIQPSDNFGVRCKAYGGTVSGNSVWDWIPGWGCWVSAHYTNSGCEDGVAWC